MPTEPEITDAMVEAALDAAGLTPNRHNRESMRRALSAALAAGVAPGVKLAEPARPDVTALREARDAINHALMALPFPSAASARRAWDGLIDVRRAADAALAQSAAPVQQAAPSGEGE